MVMELRRGILGLALVASFIGTLMNHSAHAQEDDVSEEETGQEESGTLICYLCNSTDECALKQDADNSTTVECTTGQHCWTWKEEEDGVVSYRRGCDVECNDVSKELDCKSSNNVTECALCCSTNLCNDGTLNGSTMLKQVSLMSLMLFPASVVCWNDWSL